MMTKEQYTKEIERLEELAFYANMSDDYRVTCRELAAIAISRMELDNKARESGII